MSDAASLAAIRDFENARRQAALQQFLANLRRHPVELLSFDEVSQDLGAEGMDALGLQDIPLDAIVGSVSRYEDYTRSFFPRRDEDRDRWIKVKEYIERAGMKPIDVFKIGEAYFVRDGHHRVSVSRKMGYSTIAAYVTDVETRVPLSPKDDVDEIICKSRYASFLEKTNLDKLRPGARLMMNICGQYQALLEQIEADRRRLATEQGGREVPYEEAVTHWYDDLYLPLVELIRRQGIQHDFPELTETDLYVLVTRHRAELEQRLEWRVDSAAAAGDLARRRSRRPAQVFDRIRSRILDLITPDALEAGPSTGRWREERLARRTTTTAFGDILVPGRGLEADLTTFRHAAMVAKSEHARVLGLHVVKDVAEVDSESVRSLRAAFERNCREMGIEGEFATEVGPVARKIVERAAWADLLALSLVRRSEPKTLTGFGTNFNKILQRSTRPVLVVPEGANSALDRVLLAYDGSPKAKEALYLAAYMAGRWQTKLAVVTSGKESALGALEEANHYLLDRGVNATYVQDAGSPDEAILAAAKTNASNLIVMGSFGFRPVVQLLVGSTVEKVLAAYGGPVLICR